MDDIEKLRQKYYDAINLLQDEQDIINALPTTDFRNFFPLIAGLITKIETELQKLQDELSASQDEKKEFIEYINEEIEITNKKISICQKLLEKAKKDETIIDEFEKQPIKNIVFATTASGNICFEKDLKAIPEECYQEISEMLNKFSAEVIEEKNPKKEKNISRNNNKLNGIHELKGFQIRIYYKIISSDVVYVFMICEKKNTNSDSFRQDIITRASSQNHQYEFLKKQMENPHINGTIINEHHQILTNIYDYLKKKKRGRNGE